MGKTVKDIVDGPDIYQRWKVVHKESKLKSKRRKRKKYLEELHRNVLEAKKTLDNKTRGIDKKTGKRKGPKKICDRLLPESLIGIYRNGAKGKGVCKRDPVLNTLNNARMQGDVLKLLKGPNSSATRERNAEGSFSDLKIPESNSQQRNDDKYSPVLVKPRDRKWRSFVKEADASKALSLKLSDKQNTMSDTEEAKNNKKIQKWKRQLFGDDEDVPTSSSRCEQTNLTIENEQYAKGDSKNICWSPITRYEELCERIRVENFNDAEDRNSDLLDKVKGKLQAVYEKNRHTNFLSKGSEEGCSPQLLNPRLVNNKNTSADKHAHCWSTEFQVCTYSEDSEFSDTQEDAKVQHMRNDRDKSTDYLHKFPLPNDLFEDYVEDNANPTSIHKIRLNTALNDNPEDSSEANSGIRGANKENGNYFNYEVISPVREDMRHEKNVPETFVSFDSPFLSFNSATNVKHEKRNDQQRAQPLKIAEKRIGRPSDSKHCKYVPAILRRSNYGVVDKNCFKDDDELPSTSKFVNFTKNEVLNKRNQQPTALQAVKSSNAFTRSQWNYVSEDAEGVRSFLPKCVNINKQSRINIVPVGNDVKCRQNNCKIPEYKRESSEHLNNQDFLQNVPWQYPKASANIRCDDNNNSCICQRKKITSQMNRNISFQNNDQKRHSHDVCNCNTDPRMNCMKHTALHEDQNIQPHFILQNPTKEACHSHTKPICRQNTAEFKLLNGVQNLQILPDSQELHRSFNECSNDLQQVSHVVLRDTRQPNKYRAQENGNNVQKIPIFLYGNGNKNVSGLNAIEKEIPFRKPVQKFMLVPNSSLQKSMSFEQYLPITDKDVCQTYMPNEVPSVATQKAQIIAKPITGFHVIQQPMEASYTSVPLSSSMNQTTSDQCNYQYHMCSGNEQKELYLINGNLVLGRKQHF